MIQRIHDCMNKPDQTTPHPSALPFLQPGAIPSQMSVTRSRPREMRSPASVLSLSSALAQTGVQDGMSGYVFQTDESSRSRELGEGKVASRRVGGDGLMEARLKLRRPIRHLSIGASSLISTVTAVLSYPLLNRSTCSCPFSAIGHPRLG